MKSKSFTENLATNLDKDIKGRKLGNFISLGIIALLFILNLPFVNWLGLADAQTMVNKLQMSDETIATLHMHYSLFNLLQFVQNSGIGAIGLFSAILFILIICAMYFMLASAVKIIFNKTKRDGQLGIMLTVKCAFIFEFFTAVGTVALMIFAKARLGYNLFSCSFVVYLVCVLSAIAYALVKILEHRERMKYKEHGFAKEFAKNWVLFLMLVPTFIYFMINNYLPMIGVYFAFTNFNFRDGLWASPFIGFKNFEFLYKAQLWKLTRNTILYNLVFIGVGNVLQIFFAILISQVTVKWFKKTSQTLMFMPYFVSFVILKVLVYNMFEYDYGLVNNIVTSFGGEKIDFYNNPSYWPLLITLFYMWKNIGYGMVVYLATITGIDTELYEAAKVDGANVFQQIKYITLPQIKPTFIILLLYALGGIMKGQFELFYQMVGNNGVLYDVTDIFDTYVYRITTTQPTSFGLATAAGLFQSLFGFVIVMLTNWLVKRKNPEYALF